MNYRYIKRNSDDILIDYLERPLMAGESVVEYKDRLILNDRDSGAFLYAHQVGDPYLRDLNYDTTHLTWYKKLLKEKLQFTIMANYLDILEGGVTVSQIVARWTTFKSDGASMTNMTDLNNHYNSAIDFVNLPSSFYVGGENF